jgi:hypothetical protein
VDPFISDLPAKYWSNIKVVVTKFLETHGTKCTTPDAVIQLNCV